MYKKFIRVNSSAIRRLKMGPAHKECIKRNVKKVPRWWWWRMQRKLATDLFSSFYCLNKIKKLSKKHITRKKFKNELNLNVQIVRKLHRSLLKTKTKNFGKVAYVCSKSWIKRFTNNIIWSGKNSGETRHIVEYIAENWLKIC